MPALPPAPSLAWSHVHALYDDTADATRMRERVAAAARAPADANPLAVVVATTYAHEWAALKDVELQACYDTAKAFFSRSFQSIRGRTQDDYDDMVPYTSSRSTAWKMKQDTIDIVALPAKTAENIMQSLLTYGPVQNVSAYVCITQVIADTVTDTVGDQFLRGIGMLEQGMDAKTWFIPPPSLCALPDASDLTRQQAYYIAGRAISRILSVIDLRRHPRLNTTPATTRGFRSALTTAVRVALTTTDTTALPSGRVHGSDFGKLHYGDDADGALMYANATVFEPFLLAARYRLWAFQQWEPHSQRAGNNAWSVVEDALYAVSPYREGLRMATRAIADRIRGAQLDVDRRLVDTFCEWCAASLARTDSLIATRQWTNQQNGHLSQLDKANRRHLTTAESCAGADACTHDAIFACMWE